MVFQADVRAVNAPPARLHHLDQARPAHVNTERFNPGVEALQAWRGVLWTGAVTMMAERGDRTRVDTPKALMTCLGLMPAEDSRAERRRQGSRTQAGNPHARRVLVEGAWASRDPATVSRHLHVRRATPPHSLQDLSWTAPGRRGKRYRRLMARGQHANQVVVTMARALVGCMWAMAKAVPVTR
jgi:hypothetical protein